MKARNSVTEWGCKAWEDAQQGQPIGLNYPEEQTVGIDVLIPVQEVIDPRPSPDSYLKKDKGLPAKAISVSL